MSILQCKLNDGSLSFDDKSGNYEIIYRDFSWVSQGRKPHIILRRTLGKKVAYTYRSFMSAKHKSHEVQDGKIISTYSGFTAFGKKLDFSIICTARLKEKGEVDFTIRTENEKDMDIQSLYYPSAFNSKEECKHSYTLDTMRQGLLVPDNYAENRLSLFLNTYHWRKVNTGDCYMPFWGRVCDNKGYVSIIDTPYDATIFSCFGKHKAFLTSVNWMASMGHLSYERKVKMRFFTHCDYNTLAKAFREYLKAKGELVTIDEKIKKNPTVKNLIGTPILHLRGFESISPDSTKYYKKGEINEMVHATFDERINQYEKIKSLGLEKLYIHTDGWGEGGYDNNHPYILPPAPQLGGFDGMKRLSNKCDELGYTFAIHDQYRDQYYSCKKFDEADSVVNIDGSKPYCDTWLGGAHTWLCASKALSYLKTTHDELEENGVFVKGVYLDVFAVMWGDECYNPDHPLTREQSIKARGECFDYLRNKGIIVSSEEPASLMVNYLDLVHHAPYALRPQHRGEAVGIPVPLANLVYHDCVFVPWIVCGEGGWGIPNGDNGKLHCILNSQSPYFMPFVDDKIKSMEEAMRKDNTELLPEDELKKEIEKMQEVCAIEKKLYNVEMVSHKFLDAARRVQQTTYANGTVITVDFDKQSYQIDEVK